MSFRLRLALLFAGTITVLVIATCAATYLVVRESLRSDARGDATRLAQSAAGVDNPEELSLDRLAGPDARVWLTDGSGRVIARSHAADDGDHTLAQVQRTINAAASGSTLAKAPRNEGGYAIVLLGNSAIESSLSTLLSTLIAVGLAVVLVAALAGALLARRALEPVERMRRQVDAIPGDALERRISEGRPDELGRLAAAFNRLLQRTQLATEQQQRFVADASHELRTPITALQGHARIVARAAERGDLEQARESAQIVAETGDRMARTMGELLALAESDGARHEMATVRLDHVVAEAVEELRAAYPDREVDAEVSEATVDGDAGRLGETVKILLDNALKYSPADTVVAVTVQPDHTAAVLTVRDHGPGLAGADREHAFERFYRGTAARGTAGSGLGLAIAQAVVERHHGRIKLAAAPGGGTLVTVTLPASTPHPHP